MQKIRGSYPMKVQRIIFTDGTHLDDRTAILAGDFLIVEGDGPPTMYNINRIAELQKVEEMRPEMHLNSF